MGAPQTSVSLTQAAAIQGQLGNSSMMKDAESLINGEASAEIPFGVMVQQGATVQEALKLTATNNKLVGITVFSHDYQKPVELGDTGMKPDVVMSVLARGKVWVPVEEAVTRASAVLVRAVAAGAEVAGAFRDTADGADCIDISHMARFLTETTGPGLALLEFDIVNRGADVAD